MCRDRLRMIRCPYCSRFNPYVYRGPDREKTTVTEDPCGYCGGKVRYCAAWDLKVFAEPVDVGGGG